MERVVLFLLSQVVERSSQEEALFSPHPHTELGKLLWRDGEAVGFYTIKQKGSLCGRWTSQCYLLPVLDTVMVRRRWRRRGLGLQMLEDFCSSYPKEEALGVSSPLSPSMVAVCRKFLQHEEHRARLYEVEAPGGWTQRRNIWLNIKLGRYAFGINEEACLTSGETVRNKEDSSKKTQLHNSTLDFVSLENTCDTNSYVPQLTDSSEEHITPCDTSQGQSSLSTKFSGTGCNLRAQAADPNCGPPTRRSESPYRKQALKSKSSQSADPRRAKPEAEEMLQRAKRVRRT